MRLYFILMLFLLLFSSCREKTRYEMSIMIKNNSINEITVELFPKSEYVHYNLYKFSDIGSGYRERKFNILPKEDGHLFSSKNLDQTPYGLAIEIFDSIHINLNEKTIKFSNDTVIGYSENLFAGNSIWEYKVINYYMPTMFKQNPVESHVYSFIITEDKLSDKVTFAHGIGISLNKKIFSNR